MRDKIGGYPYETKKEGSNVILTFFHKGEKIMHPNASKIILTLTKEDIKTLSKL